MSYFLFDFRAENRQLGPVERRENGVGVEVESTGRVRAGDEASVLKAIQWSWPWEQFPVQVFLSQKWPSIGYVCIYPKLTLNSFICSHHQYFIKTITILVSLFSRQTG